MTKYFTPESREIAYRELNRQYSEKYRRNPDNRAVINMRKRRWYKDKIEKEKALKQLIRDKLRLLNCKI